MESIKDLNRVGSIIALIFGIIFLGIGVVSLIFFIGIIFIIFGIITFIIRSNLKEINRMIDRGGIQESEGQAINMDDTRIYPSWSDNRNYHVASLSKI